MAGSHDADIVRSWHRWDLNGPGRVAFLRGSAERRHPHLDDRAVAVWSIWSRAHGARVRASTGDGVASAMSVAAHVRLANPRRLSVHAASTWPAAHAS